VTVTTAPNGLHRTGGMKAFVNLLRGRERSGRADAYFSSSSVSPFSTVRSFLASAALLLAQQRLVTSGRSLATMWCGRFSTTICKAKYSPRVSWRLSLRLAGRTFRSRASRDRREDISRENLGKTSAFRDDTIQEGVPNIRISAMPLGEKI
jgi:hypothetical protein